MIHHSKWPRNFSAIKAAKCGVAICSHFSSIFAQISLVFELPQKKTSQTAEVCPSRFCWWWQFVGAWLYGRCTLIWGILMCENIKDRQNEPLWTFCVIWLAGNGRNRPKLLLNTVYWIFVEKDFFGRESVDCSRGFWLSKGETPMALNWFKANWGPFQRYNLTWPFLLY